MELVTALENIDVAVKSKAFPKQGHVDTIALQELRISNANAELAAARRLGDSALHAEIEPGRSQQTRQ